MLLYFCYIGANTIASKNCPWYVLSWGCGSKIYTIFLTSLELKRNSFQLLKNRHRHDEWPPTVSNTVVFILLFCGSWIIFNVYFILSKLKTKFRSVFQIFSNIRKRRSNFLQPLFLACFKNFRNTWYCGSS